mgnify:CR=1 FL=1
MDLTGSTASKLVSHLKNFLFIAPAVIIFSIFYIFPFYYIFELSLFEWDGISPTKFFVGIQNFQELMADGIWWSSLWHAAYITIIALTFQNALAFVLALATGFLVTTRLWARLALLGLVAISGCVLFIRADA